MTETNRYVTNEIIRHIKYYSHSWSTIGRYFLLFPLGVSLLKAKTIHGGIEAMLGYPIGIVAMGMYGGIFGLGVGLQQHQKEVLPKWEAYAIDIVSTATDELNAYAKMKLDKISKKL